MVDRRRSKRSRLLRNGRPVGHLQLVFNREHFALFKGWNAALTPIRRPDRRHRQMARRHRVAALGRLSSPVYDPMTVVVDDPLAGRLASTAVAATRRAPVRGLVHAGLLPPASPTGPDHRSRREARRCPLLRWPVGVAENGWSDGRTRSCGSARGFAASPHRGPRSSRGCGPPRAAYRDEVSCPEKSVARGAQDDEETGSRVTVGEVEWAGGLTSLEECGPKRIALWKQGYRRVRRWARKAPGGRPEAVERRRLAEEVVGRVERWRGP